MARDVKQNQARGVGPAESPGTRGGEPLPRVLYAVGLDPSLKFGSLEEQTLLLARAFREQGGLLLPLFESAAVGKTRSAYASAGIEAESLSLHRFRPGTLRRMLTLVRRHRINAIHWSFYGPINPYLWWLSLLRRGLAHYMTDHISREQTPGRTSSRTRRAVKNLLLRRYRRILCVSDFVRESLLREGVSTELFPCSHFVNTDRFRPDPAARDGLRKKLGADGHFVVLAVAHLIPQKGIEVLLRAMTRLPEGARAWIVGEGPEAQSLRRMADELGVTPQVQFLGNREEVQPFMQAADCLVCPSIWQEAAGLVNIEALACGVPVVASRVGGIPEIVEHGTTGLLFAAGEPDELAAAIRRLAEDPDLCRMMGEAARKAAVKRFSAERKLDEFLDFYRTVDPARSVDV